MRASGPISIGSSLKASRPESCRLKLGGFGSRVFWSHHEFVGPFVSHCCATVFRLLVQTKGSKGKDTRVARRREAPVHCDARSGGMRQKLTSLWRRSNSLPHRRSAPDTLRPCASRRFTRGPNTNAEPKTRATLAHRTEIRRAAPFLPDQARLIRHKDRDLERATASLPVLGPLGVAPSSTARPRGSSRMSERSEFRLRSAWRAAQGIGAKRRRKTGCLSITRHACGQANISDSHSSAKPQVELACAVDSKLADPSHGLFVSDPFLLFLLCDSLSFACPNESEQSKRHPGTAPAGADALRHAAATGCVQNSDRFGDPQTCCTHRRNAPDTRRHYVSTSPCNGAEYRRRANDESHLACRAQIHPHDSALVELGERLIRHKRARP